MITETYIASPTTRLSVAREYFDAGEYDNCLAVISSLPESERLSLRAQLLVACVHSENNRHLECLEVLNSVGVLVDDAEPDLKAKYYGQRAMARNSLGDKDGALIDYEASRFWAQESGNKIVEGTIRNNLAKVYSANGRLDDALREVEVTIRIMEDSNDLLNLGRALDQQSQILSDHGQVEKAAEISKRAIDILKLVGNEKCLDEARTTYAHALIAIGCELLKQNDPIARFLNHRKAVSRFQITLDAETVQVSLDRCGGSVYKAADMLNVNHSAMINAIEKFGINRKPKRRRAKSLRVIHKSTLPEQK